MLFSIVVNAAPVQSQGAETALRFAKAVLRQGHQIYRVFFYRDGVHNGTALNCQPQDEQNIPHAWAELSQEHQLDLVICIAAGARRGVINASEAKRYSHAQHNLAPEFELSGLGQLVDATLKSDRVVTFGG